MNIPKEEIKEKEVVEKTQINFKDTKLKVSEILNDNQFDKILCFQVNNEEELDLFNIMINNNIENYFLGKLSENKKEVLWILLTDKGNNKDRELFIKIISLKSNLFKLLTLESIKRGNFHFPKDKLSKLTECINNWSFNYNDPIYSWFLNNINLY